MDLDEMLEWLVRQGCEPSIYYRGGRIWRAHINRCGNSWRDGLSPLKALREAVRAWERRGRPMDGVDTEEAREEGK